jgi:hypothetical protein
MGNEFEKNEKDANGKIDTRDDDFDPLIDRTQSRRRAL